MIHGPTIPQWLIIAILCGIVAGLGVLFVKVPKSRLVVLPMAAILALFAGEIGGRLLEWAKHTGDNAPPEK
jgi:hypothetical protein